MSVLTTETTDIHQSETPAIETRTPLYLYRSEEGVLLVHPDRHGQHHLVYGTDGYLYHFDPEKAFDTSLTVEHLETSALPT